MLDDEDSLVGIVSISDLAREAERQTAETESEISEMEVGGTLAAICQPNAAALTA